MNYQHQRTKDDCFAACLASILEVELSSVPALGVAEEWQEYWRRLHFEFLLPLGLALIEIPGCFGAPCNGYCIRGVWVFRAISGSRAAPHAQVMKNGEVVFDPAQSHGSLVDFEAPAYGYWVVYPLDPARVVVRGVGSDE